MTVDKTIASGLMRIVELLEKRAALVDQVALYKQKYNHPIVDPEREKKIEKMILDHTTKKTSKKISQYYKKIFVESYARQNRITKTASTEHISKTDLVDLYRPEITKCDEELIRCLDCIYQKKNTDLLEGIKQIQMKRRLSTTINSLLEKICEDDELE
ncbi:MAG: hypothetical protein CMF48_05610 [Legionellales bacterium]|nr:hypothetical protein [Legionellales bacterium]|tara:strand:- start:646 stop:1119 length:474 start_codon:yes stop_codon:yes gene_type:complete